MLQDEKFEYLRYAIYFGDGNKINENEGAVVKKKKLYYLGKSEQEKLD